MSGILHRYLMENYSLRHIIDHLELVELGLAYKDKLYLAISKDKKIFVAGYNITINPIPEKPDLVSYKFTRIGDELAKLINVTPNKNYLDAFIKASEHAFSVKLSQL
jgi:hypothetical protein